MNQNSLLVGALYLGDFNDVWDVQVRSDRWKSFPNQVSLVGLLPAKHQS